MKILVVRLDGFAEVLLSTPLIRCLHQQATDAEIHVLTSYQQAFLLRHNPNIFNLHVWEEGNAVSQLQEEGFDYVFDLQNDGQSRRLAKQLKAKVYTFVLKGERKFFRLVQQKHWVDQYFELFAPLGIRNDGAGLDYFIPDEAKVSVTDIPHSHHAGFLCIAIGGLSAKKLPLQKLCAEINYPVILLGSREDILSGEGIASADAIKIYNACGKFSFEESADLARQSKLLVACSPGWMQAGAALKKEMIILQHERTSIAESSPYYGEIFLQHNPTPFDSVQSKAPWWRSTPKPIQVNEVIETVNRRLRKQ